MIALCIFLYVCGMLPFAITLDAVEKKSSNKPLTIGERGFFVLIWPLIVPCVLILGVAGALDGRKGDSGKVPPNPTPPPAPESSRPTVRYHKDSVRPIDPNTITGPR